MAVAKRKYWLHCEWGSYAIPIALGLEPGADVVLGQVNQLMLQFTQAGYEPVQTIPVGPPVPLVLEDTGQLTVQRTLILWGLKDFREPAVQQEHLDVAAEQVAARRADMIAAERHKATEDAKREVAGKVEAAKKDASILEHIGAKLDESK